MHLGLNWQAVCVPYQFMGALLTLLKFQMASRLTHVLLMSFGSKEEEPTYTCLSEAKASHSQRMWAEVSSYAPHLLHSGLSDIPIRWRCLLRVLYPVRRPVTALDCVLFKDRNLTLAPRRGSEICSRACLWVSPRPRHHTQCLFTNQRPILLRISCLETPTAGSGPTNFRAEPSLASLSAISFPRTPAWTGTQYISTACRVEKPSTPFGTDGPMETLFWRPWELSKPPDYQSRYVLLWSTLKLNFMNTRQDSIYLSLKDCSISS
jgi:hypothetical protein